MHTTHVKNVTCDTSNIRGKMYNEKKMLNAKVNVSAYVNAPCHLHVYVNLNGNAILKQL